MLGEPAEDRLGKVRRFTALAAELGESPAQLAIAWCLRNPNVSSVILGARRVSQLEENLRALDVAARMDEPTWRQVESRRYDPWDREHLVLDTAHLSPAESVAMITAAMARIER